MDLPLEKAEIGYSLKGKPFLLIRLGELVDENLHQEIGDRIDEFHKRTQVYASWTAYSAASNCVEFHIITSLKNHGLVIGMLQHLLHILAGEHMDTEENLHLLPLSERFPSSPESARACYRTFHDAS